MMSIISRLAELSARQAYQYMTDLVSRFGVRVAGTEADNLAAEYLAGLLTGMGLKPTLEWFPQPLWLEKQAGLTLSNGDSIAALSVCFGGSGVIEGEVVAVGDPLFAEDVADLALQGKIALIDGRNAQVDYPDEPQTDLLMDSGVIGLIFVAGEHQQGGLPQVYYNYKRWLGGGTLPSVIISYRDCQKLKAICARSPRLRARILVEAEVIWSQSVNVCFEIKGSSRPEEMIILGAHRDSTATSPGASDDASGCGIIIELGRVFAQTGPPRRTLHFILYGGHETGLHGSEDWLRRRLGQIDRMTACLQFDIAGMIEGQDVAAGLGGAQWLALVRQAGRQVGLPLVVERAPFIGDMANYAALGIPSVNFARYGAARYHTPLDTLEGTGPQGLESLLLFGGALLSMLADRAEPLDLGRFSWEDLRMARRYAERWKWGVV